MPELEIQKHKYLSKSIRIYKIYGYALLIALFTTIILKPLIKESYFLIDFMIGFPILIIILLSPVGLYYSWKSKKEKESNSIKRLRYFLGHAFFFILTILFIVLLVSDLKHFF